MKQILQNLRTGELELAEVPCAAPRPRHLLIRSRVSLVSAGTERMLLRFGRANLLQKARQQPDKVRAVLEKVRTDGLAATVEAVRAKLDQPLPLGYCNVGVIEQVGVGAEEFHPGDRVVSNGYHAEMVHVPCTLCAPVPHGVTDEAAAFTVPAAIALQALRLAQPEIGEIFAVSGLGLIGLLAVLLLQAQGCRVLGMDPDSARLELARRFGATTVDLSRGEDPADAALRISGGAGADGVLIAATTPSSEPVHQAAEMCRKRGRIVLVGVTGLELSRADFYKKELSFQVSCSYGPGRYDPEYEERGRDYPYDFVRWTARRNFEAVLALLAGNRLEVRPLITHRFAFADAPAAYEVLQGPEPALGILLNYGGETPVAEPGPRATTIPVGLAPRSGNPIVGFLGAGNYATKVLIPAFASAGAGLKVIASAGGLSASHAARKFGFEAATTGVDQVLLNPAITAVVIATRHDTHADLVCKALAAGKHVFVEKPLAIRRDELEKVEAAARGASSLLMVGFNRRFSPHALKVRSLLEGLNQPKSFVMTVNAGPLPPGHWTQDPQVGGGRIVGEACHFVDLLRFLAASPFQRIQAARAAADTMTFTFQFQDGSLGTVHYFANGHRSFPKERLEVFCAGRVLVLDNFRTLTGYGWPNFRKMKLWSQDKGNAAAVAAFVAAVREGKPAPIPAEQLLEVSRATLELGEVAGG